MSWETVNHLATWACALSALACCIAIVWLIRTNERGIKAAMAAIEGLGETHMMGLEVVTMDLDRLKARVVDLEQWRDEP